MRISVINFSGVIGDDEVASAVRAVNRQVVEDFAPRWQRSAQLVVVPATGGDPAPELVTSDAVLYVCDTPKDNNVGYHESNRLGIPYGFVFTELAQQIGEDWSITLSHEALEMIADPQLNSLKVGPAPSSTTMVSYLEEVCDPVQSTSYAIDGVRVSNFVTPGYFVLDTARRSTNHLGLDVAPFGVASGGYTQYIDANGTTQSFTIAGRKVLDAKTAYLGKRRRARRHASARLGQQPVKPATRRAKKQ